MKSIACFAITILLLASCMPLVDSSTSAPASTPGPTLTITRTPGPRESPTLSATVDRTRPAMGFVQENCATLGLDAKVSPDGEWLASPCLDEDNAHIRIARFDGTKAWDLYFEEITDWPPCILYQNQYGEDACFWAILYIDHWYQDGRYVFVTADYQIDRGTTFNFGLYRIDSQTGRVSAYLPVNGTGYNYAFSPNDENYAYVTESDNYLLHVVSMETGQDSTFTVPGRYSDLGELMWSLDSHRLVLVSRGIGWDENPAVGFSLTVLDAQNGEFTTLISNDVRRFSPRKWLSEDILLLSGFDSQVYFEYQLTISNGQLLTIPTMTPPP